MGRKIILALTISLIIFSLSSCGAKKEEKSDASTVSTEKSTKSEKTKKAEKEQKVKLNESIMPAIDIIAQIRDTADGVLRGDTETETAVTIFTEIGNFLTKTKLDLMDLKTPSQESLILKDRALAVVDDCISELDILTDVTRSKDPTTIEESINILDEKIEELRSIADIEAPKAEEE